ncbi:MAG: phosphatase PAP2 family protein [Thermotogae bacterium]|nr:phosphatase PAP2 family protein [Thermotogota bacterium]
MVEGLVFGTALVLTPVSVYAWDEPLRGWILEHRNEEVDLILGVVNPLGDGRLHVLMWGGTFLLGTALKNEDLQDFGKWGTVSFVSTGLLTVGLKSLIGRARPYLNLGPHSFSPLTLDDDYHSLPSGHTSVAFSTAGYLWARTSSPWIRWGSLVLASGVGAARIYKDRHWLSDVILGAGLGFSVGYFTGRIGKR